MAEWGGGGVARNGIMYRKSEARGSVTGKKLSRNRHASNPNNTDTCLSILKKMSTYFLTSPT